MTLSALWSSEAVEAINVAASLFGINGILMHIIMYIHSNSTKLPFVQSRMQCLSRGALGHRFIFLYLP